MRKFVQIIWFSVVLTVAGEASELFRQMAFDSVPAYRDIISRYGSDPTRVIEAKFYPIGWSRDGKFAYAIEKPNEAADCQPAGFYIQNMVTDKMVARIEGCYETPDPDHPDIHRYFAKKSGQIRRLLHRYGIRQTITDLRSFPIGSDQRGYGVDLHARYANAPQIFGNSEKFLTSLRLTLHKKRNYAIQKSKTIFTQHLKPTDGYYDAVVTGYIDSPFEQRIAVILVYIQRGWEGPPNVTQIKLVGGSLVKEFSVSAPSDYSGDRYARVSGIRWDDALAVRTGPSTRYARIGDLPPDARGIEILT